ncbi:MAG: NADH-quinone oxidoreductase subunit L [Deltaproteobacteria bacterium]|nr:NADH-quinone oxidoreductase subunit L [Deltaproteobacteria bacterium]
MTYLRWIIFLPLIGVLFNLFVAPRTGRRGVNLVAPGVILGAFLVALSAFFELKGLAPGSALVDNIYPWITAGQLHIDFALRVDALSAVMILIVTGVGFLIHLYSVGYMAHDEDYARFFTYLNLFSASMLLLVLGENLALLFVGWEGVGLCSYLLIGFWYTDPEKAKAGNKAFIVNRIGDAGFLLGMFLLFWTLADKGVWTLSFSEIEANMAHLALMPAVITSICLLLFVGATGKSAQIPLFVWLPDAMAGPTPVSALIHAATMVTAGIYMMARLHFLYTLSPDALHIIAWFGAATAIFAATIGFAQTDIKKVLAYSTVSQLGYMVLGIGVGAYGAGVFHLMTHAFFKALLFLGAGSVIHGMHEEQDIRKMGGLLKRMPWTGWTFLIGCIAIAGVPGLSGHYSKDLILEEAYGKSILLYIVGTVGAGMTAFYMFRLFFVTFWKETRASHEVTHHIHESPWTMTVPLVILAVLSVIGGWSSVFPIGDWLKPIFGGHHPDVPAFIRLMPTVMGIVGIVLAYLMYGRKANPAEGMDDLPIDAWHKGALNKWYIDEIYDAWIVRPMTALADGFWKIVDIKGIDATVNDTAQASGMFGGALRLWQTGNVQSYAMSFLIGAMAIFGLGYYLW